MKILCIEDDQSTSELLSATLAAQCYAVDTIADGSAGLEMATRWNYDLILLDILLPSLNGIEICRRLRTQGCQTPILILTTKDTNEDIITGLDAGADDYVAKTCASSQLLARVRALLRRSGSTSLPPVLKWGHLCFDPASAQVTYQQKAFSLRPKEYSLLELFLRHPQRIFSRSAIIDHLWAVEEVPVEGSVTNLIKDLRHRLKSVGMEEDLIETVYGLGYRLKAEPKIATESSMYKKSSTHKEVLETKNEYTSEVTALGTIWAEKWSRPNQQRGRQAIQQITNRFQQTLKQRVATLEAAERSLQAGNLSASLQKAAEKEAHQLAGGLGTFGWVKASETAKAIEQLLDQPVHTGRLAAQLSALLQELKQELVQQQPSSN
jgi:DNA-binding response OmpR family regulator/HPt (histidine-containing phosphotransfer) domain-containing protein